MKSRIVIHAVIAAAAALSLVACSGSEPTGAAAGPAIVHSSGGRDVGKAAADAPSRHAQGALHTEGKDDETQLYECRDNGGPWYWCRCDADFNCEPVD